VILLLEIRRGTPVKQDTVAVLEMQGLTGLSKINLAGGSRESPPLATEAGEPYPVIRSAPSLFGRLELSLSRLLENVNHSSQRLNELLNDRNLHAFSRAMEHVEVLSGTLAAGSGTLETIMNDLAATLENTRAASAQLPATVKRMNAAAGALERMADEIAQAAHTLRASGDELGRFAGQSLPEATATVEELHQAAANLRRLSERLERNPSILLFGETRAMPGPGE
jgi:phospholipid/cholesterol/gamma-HCH transport system substrate-binding protein